MGLLEKIVKNDIEITDQLNFQHELRMFYEQLFKKTICNASSKIVNFLDNISLPVILILLIKCKHLFKKLFSVFKMALI